MASFADFERLNWVAKESMLTLCPAKPLAKLAAEK
jgi:hypothetical protein